MGRSLYTFCLNAACDRLTIPNGKLGVAEYRHESQKHIIAVRMVSQNGDATRTRIAPTKLIPLINNAENCTVPIER
jgi:hypothetical protein